VASERLTGGGRRPIADGGTLAGVTPDVGRRSGRRRVPALLAAAALLVVAVLLGVGVGTVGPSGTGDTGRIVGWVAGSVLGSAGPALP